ncbi:hypothetical protein P7C73_g6668, partial [Tremellales sp. Uapishka_1]
MSRSATATPPPPPTYFPHRNSTPTMRHAASPHLTAAHYPTHLGHQKHHGRRRTKNIPVSLVPTSAPTNGLKRPSPQVVDTTSGLGLSFEHGPNATPPPQTKDTMPYRHPTSSSYSLVSAISTATSSTDSFSTSRSDDSNPDDSNPTPPLSTTGVGSVAESPLSTPSSSTPSVNQQAPPTQNTSPISGVSIPFLPSKAAVPAMPKSSWVDKLGKVMVTTLGMGSEKKTRKELVQPQTSKVDIPVATASVPTPVAAQHGGIPPLESFAPVPITGELPDYMKVMNEDELLLERKRIARREFYEAESRRIEEFARLCSQWPQSGYNMAKWGPNGCPQLYQPQSYCNPQLVAVTMQRQAQREHELASTAATYFACSRSHRAPSEVDTEPSIESYQSSQNSPTSSMSMSTEDVGAEQRTAADIRAAMGSPLMPLGTLGDDDSQIYDSLPSPPSKSIKTARSMSELDGMPSMVISSDEHSMEIDQDLHERQIKPRPLRAQSCGAKRSCSRPGVEEEKRRKVDESMVVADAVQSGVIQPATQQNLSASAPDLSRPAEVFGHVVKTSDTHPIILSPFFPDDLLPTLAAHQLRPAPHGPFASVPLLLDSSIDVPSLLLSFGQGHPPTIVPSPTRFSAHSRNDQKVPLGNLLLSSVPGKRLRMEGPVKGRGPVCRDLATDLRRIKNEGVGCLVCCLDDGELELLGVPWEMYKEVAADTGLDIIRLPMPDGFTPHSVNLFDAQVTLLVTKYSLQGINTLVHCRGGIGRAGLTACAWAIKMGFVQPHPSLVVSHDEHQITMSIVERAIAMIRSRRGLKAIESFEQVQFLATYVSWLRRAAGV